MLTIELGYLIESVGYFTKMPIKQGHCVEITRWVFFIRASLSVPQHNAFPGLLNPKLPTTYNNEILEIIAHIVKCI